MEPQEKFIYFPPGMLCHYARTAVACISIAYCAVMLMMRMICTVRLQMNIHGLAIESCPSAHPSVKHVHCD